jgi:hypothetical protein
MWTSDVDTTTGVEYGYYGEDEFSTVGDFTTVGNPTMTTAHDITATDLVRPGIYYYRVVGYINESVYTKSSDRYCTNAFSRTRFRK